MTRPKRGPVRRGSCRSISRRWGRSIGALARQGFGREIDLVLGANTPRFAAAVPPEAEVLLEELTVFGTPAQARERLAQWHATGADMPLVFIRPSLAPDEIERTLSAFAPMLESERAREARR